MEEDLRNQIAELRSNYEIVCEQLARVNIIPVHHSKVYEGKAREVDTSHVPSCFVGHLPDLGLSNLDILQACDAYIVAAASEEKDGVVGTVAYLNNEIVVKDVFEHMRVSKQTAVVTQVAYTLKRLCSLYPQLRRVLVFASSFKISTAQVSDEHRFVIATCKVLTVVKEAKLEVFNIRSCGINGLFREHFQNLFYTANPIAFHEIMEYTQFSVSRRHETIDEVMDEEESSRRGFPCVKLVDDSTQVEAPRRIRQDAIIPTGFPEGDDYGHLDIMIYKLENEPYLKDYYFQYSTSANHLEVNHIKHSGMVQLRGSVEYNLLRFLAQVLWILTQNSIEFRFVIRTNNMFVLTKGLKRLHNPNRRTGVLNRSVEDLCNRFDLSKCTRFEMKYAKYETQIQSLKNNALFAVEQNLLERYLAPPAACESCKTCMICTELDAKERIRRGMSPRRTYHVITSKLLTCSECYACPRCQARRGAKGSVESVVSRE